MDWATDEVPAPVEGAAGHPELDAESLHYLDQLAAPAAMRRAEIAEVHREGLSAFIRTDVPPEEGHELARCRAEEQRRREEEVARQLGRGLSLTHFMS